MFIKNVYKRWYWKRFHKKYDRHIPFKMPKLNAGIDIDVLEEMRPFKRHFPFFGYRWRAAGRTHKKKESCTPY